MQTPPHGSLVWRNWRAAGASTEQPLLTEHGLYSDAGFPSIGDLSLRIGPYEILGSWLGPGRGTGAVRGFLRVEHHLRTEEFDATASSSKSFHGGRIHDEMAALLALEFGVRLQAGPSHREFGPDIDALGRPTSIEPRGQRVPVLQSGHFGDMLPGTRRMVSFDELSLLPRFAELKPDDSVVIARAARLFQDGAWYADAQPWLSWLLFVSAVEVVASRWAGARFSDDDANFRDAEPDLVKDLQDAGFEEAISIAARRLAPKSGAARHFREFLMKFRPEAPEPRSVEWTQTSWVDKELKKAFVKIYGHRSAALHGGQPFPGILCLPPQILNNVPNERPLATGVATQHASWKSKDLPFHLHVFAYIVRRAVLSWWESLLPNGSTNAA